MKKFTRSAAFIALIAIVSGCSKNTVSPASSGLNGRARQINATGSITVSPASGIVFSAVTITGSNFSTVPGENVVKFNGITGIVNSATATQIVATVPSGATTGNITVTTNSTTVTTSNTFKVLQLVKVNTLKFTPTTYNSDSAYVFGITWLSIDKQGNKYGIDAYSSMGSPSQIINFSNDKYHIVYQTPVSYSLDVTYSFSLTNVVFDRQGNMYTGRNDISSANARGNIVVNYINSEIIKINPAGQASVFAGGYGGYADGNGASAHFNNITYLAIDSSDNIYVADNGNLRVRKVSPGAAVSTYAGSGQSNSNNGNAATAGFKAVIGLAIDNNRNIYAVDDQAVRKIAPDGNVSTIYTDYPGYNENILTQVTTDASNNVFVIDDAAKKVIIINTAGNIGGFTPPIADYWENYVYLLTMDGQGNLYTKSAYALYKYSLE